MTYYRAITLHTHNIRKKKIYEIKRHFQSLAACIAQIYIPNIKTICTSLYKTKAIYRRYVFRKREVGKENNK